MNGWAVFMFIPGARLITFSLLPCYRLEMVQVTQNTPLLIILGLVLPDDVI